MLCLKRQVGEYIIIGEGKTAIAICLIETQKGFVRLGVSAPKDTRIDRAEITALRIDAEPKNIPSDIVARAIAANGMALRANGK